MARRWAKESAAADVAGAEDAVARALPLRRDFHRRLLRSQPILSSRDRRRRVRLHSSGPRRSGHIQNERRQSHWFPKGWLPRGPSTSRRCPRTSGPRVRNQWRRTAFRTRRAWTRRSGAGLADGATRSLLRRLVTSPLHRLDEAEDAPAGPGVFLLSDSDQITSYYVEACQTLRIGAGNLVRGGRSGVKHYSWRTRVSSDTGLKAKLADYLGINEAKVAQYMKDHCVLRWIQLDDDARCWRTSPLAFCGPR